MLTFNKINNKSKPIAIINGGKHDGKIIYLSENDDNYECDKNMYDLEEELYNVINNDINPKYKTKMNALKREKIKNYILNNKEFDDMYGADEFTKDMYNATKEALCKKVKNEINIYDGEIMQLPDINKREVLYIAGQSGSGKTTYGSNYIKLFKKFKPKYDIYLFSRVQKDEILDQYKPIRVPLDEKLLENPIDVENELSHSLVIFDDIDTIRDKKLCEEVRHIRDTILEVGRAHEENEGQGIYSINMSHQLFNYKLTRNLLLESNFIIIFKAGTGRNHIMRLLKDNLGFDKQQIKKIMGVNSRWICIAKNVPQYVISQHSIFLI